MTNFDIDVLGYAGIPDGGPSPELVADDEQALLNNLKMQMIEKSVWKLRMKVRLPKHPHGDSNLLIPWIMSSHLCSLLFKPNSR